jgi:hypothetical protein
MADSNIDLIVAQISSILTNVSGISKVQSYAPVYLNNLNSATIWWGGITEIRNLSLKAKEVDYQVVVQINVHLSGGVEAQTTLKDVVVAARQALDNKPDLNSTCLYHNITSVENMFVTERGNVYAVGMITLVATKEEALT